MIHVGVVRGTYVSNSSIREGGSFVSAPVEEIAFIYEGIAGARHAGLRREANAREPWLPRGMELRNDRQVSALSVEDLGKIAETLGLPEVSPELLGANLLIEGVPDFSHLAIGSHLAFGWDGEGKFGGTAILKVEAYNKPCRGPGRKLAAAFGRPELEFAFVKAAKHLRGLVFSVSREGVVRAGDAVAVVPAVVNG